MRPSAARAGGAGQGARASSRVIWAALGLWDARARQLLVAAPFDLVFRPATPSPRCPPQLARKEDVRKSHSRDRPAAHHLTPLGPEIPGVRPCSARGPGASRGRKERWTGTWSFAPASRSLSPFGSSPPVRPPRQGLDIMCRLTQREAAPAPSQHVNSQHLTGAAVPASGSTE